MFRSSGKTKFDRLLEKATSKLLLEPDWDATMTLCDLVRSGETPPDYAFDATRRKLHAENPHVVLYTLHVMESLAKNCGRTIHEQVARGPFMEEMWDVVRVADRRKDDTVKGKALELIQNWAVAFKNAGAEYKVVSDYYVQMKGSGYKFPSLSSEAQAMFESDVAPDWVDGSVCHRCRAEFGLVTRQHHCRACGQVFCGQCSSKACVLPKFGIEKEVRVCDPCYDEHGPKTATASSGGGSSSSETSSPVKTGGSSGRKAKMETDLPTEYLSSSLAQQPQGPSAKKTNSGGKTEEEIKEEEELQLALALSQSEAEEAEKLRKKRDGSQFYRSAIGDEEAANNKPKSQGISEEDVSPELMRYLNRDYWETKEKDKSEPAQTPAAAAAKAAEAAASVAVPQSHANNVFAATSAMPPHGLTAAGGMPDIKSDAEMDEFVTTLKTQMEIFVNRMKSNSSRGRSIANDSSVQTMFMNTATMHSQLLRHIQEQEDKRLHYESLQDKLTQVRDARAALNALREEERERKRKEAEEAERQRQIQMQEKLEVMRKKKQEYLQYQRQLALQRMQEQEREMQLRQEQAKQQFQYMPPQPHMAMGMPPQQMYAGYMGGPPQQPYGYDPAAMAAAAAPPPSYQSLQPQPPAGAPIPPQQPAGPPSMPPQQMPPQAASQMMLPPDQQQQPQYGMQPMPGAGQGMPPAADPNPAAVPTTAAAAPAPYNMQQMASALPPQTAAQPPQPQPASVMPPAAAPAPAAAYGQPQQPMAPPPQQQQQPASSAPPPGPAEANNSLISFD